MLEPTVLNGLDEIVTASRPLTCGLKQLLNDLKRQSILTPAIARQCVLEANIQVEDVLPWSDFSHPMTDSYGRKLVYQDLQLEMLVMSWVPGDVSAIHDHGSATWGVVQCFGHGEHYSYRFENNLLTTKERTELLPGAVNAVDSDLIHQMGNPGNTYFLSLHIYGCDNPQADITADARIFDLYEGCIQRTHGGVFFNLPEPSINSRQSCLQGDLETTLRHHQQMYDRLVRIANHQPDACDAALQTKLTHLGRQILELQAKATLSNFA